MLTESATATALRSKRAADGRKKRRAAATPYGTTGAAHGSAGSDSDEEVDGSEDEHEERRVRAGERHNEKRGFFSRFVSYLPLVGKFVPDENEDDSDMTRDEAETVVEDEPETVHADDEALVVEHIDEDSHSDDGEEHDAVFVASNGRPRDDDVESVGSETVRGPPTPPSRESPSGVETVHADTAHHVENGKQPAKTHAKRHKPQESSPPVNPHYTRSQCRSPSHERSAEKAEHAPAHRPQRKRNDQRAFLPAPSQKSKMLRISSSQRRRKSSSPSPSESARTLIKQQKTISYAEYERLSRQLRDLVEPTPQAALALTKSALDEGLEEPVQTSRGAYVPGSIATHTTESSAHEGSDIAVRRLQNGENATALTLGQNSGGGVHRPLSFSGPAMRGQFSSHDDRLGRRHRPSRLLTGTKNDITSRSAYSAAVAEKILSTLNKIQNPLEREARKPTPSTSVSWAKYHLALVDEATVTERSKADEKDLKSAPPTASLPRVPVVSSTSLVSKSVVEKPSAKLNNGFASTNGASLSSQAISTTAAYPAVNAAVPAFLGNTVSKTAKMGLYSFTLPRKVLGGLDEDEDMDIHFEFSLPSALREPPKQVASSSKPKGTEAAFSFVPPSPKQKAEWAPKSVKPKEPVSAPIVEKSPVKQVSSVPASTGTNPLARFMQVVPGTWKCPSCSVTNQDKFSKCPCCETAKPTSSSSALSSPAPSKSAPAPMASGASNPLARFMQVAPGTWKCPTCSVTNEDKFAKCPCCDAAKPVGASSAKVQTPAVTSSGAGFSFGVTASSTTDTKKSDKVSSTGFSFGVAPSMKDDASKSASSSAGFSFGVQATTEKSSNAIAPATSGFSFGVAPAGKSTEAASESKSTGASKPAGFSFGVPATTTSGSVEQASFTFSAPVKEVTSSTEKPSELATTSPAPSFSFSAPSTTTSSTPSFAFGTSATVTPDEPKKTKRKAEDSISEVKTPSSKKPSGGFTFGSAAPAPVSSFGSPADTDAQKSGDSDRPTKKVFTQAALKESPTVPAFSFGVPPAGDKKDAASTGAKSFGGSFTSIAANSATAAPVVSFGSKTDESKPTAGSFGSFGTSPETKSSTPASVGSAVPAAFAFSAPSSASKSIEPAKGFSFGVPRTSSTSPVTAEASAPSKPAFSLASSSSPDPASSKPAFTFGQSASSGTGLSSSSSSTAFGSTTTTTTSSSGFGFGAPSSTSATASAPATSSAAPSFTFGASSSSPSAPAVNAGDSAMDTSGFGSTPLSVSPAFGQPGTAPSPTFGVSATQPATAFGNSGTGSFRSSSPATGQAAAFGGFRSISPAPAPGAAFGGAAFRSSSPAPTSTPAFGASSAAPSSSGFTFGASSQAPTSAISQPPQPQSFGFGAPTSSGFGGASGFGSTAAPTSTGFGAQAAAPATTFGAGTAAFGASPAPAFGAPAAPAAPAFGAPSQGGAFGAAPAFGGAASGFGSASAPAFVAAPSAAAPAFGGSAFGAPSNPSGGFGAAAPAAAGFGQPTDGGFSMGAAPPQHAKGRRILKARSRRTT